MEQTLTDRGLHWMGARSLAARNSYDSILTRLAVVARTIGQAAMQRSISLGGKGVHAPRGGKGGRKGIKRDRSGRGNQQTLGDDPQHDEEAEFSARYGQLPTAQISPEDLAAYLDARRRNWPSNTVVERKMRESEARASSGACDASPPQLSRGHGRGRGRGREGSARGGDAALAGKAGRTDRWSSGVAQADDSGPGSVAGSAALLAIGEMYADSDEAEAPVEDTGGADAARPDPDAVAVQRQQGAQRVPARKLCRFFARGRCRNGDSCAYQHSEPPVAGLTRQPAPDATARRKSLLHLLLVKEIRAERSALLQCFRHLIAARPA